MSIDLVEHLHLRLREELERCGYKLAAAARLAGEPSSQRLKDVVTGRQKCSAELLARLAATGIDLVYVLTGTKSIPVSAPALPPDEHLLVDAYRALEAADKKKLLASLLTGEMGERQTKERAVVVSGSRNRTAGRDYHEKE